LLLKEVTSSAAVAETVDAVVGAFLFRFGLSEWKSSLLISLQIIHDSREILKLSLESVHFNCDQIEWEGSKINGSQVIITLYHSMFTTTDMMKPASLITKVLCKECNQILLVEGLPRTSYSGRLTPE